MSDFTMGLAQMTLNQNKTTTETKPNESVKLYTLIKDYAQRKYNCDDNQVMRLYIGTKRSAKITNNAELISYVDGKMKPKEEVKQPEIEEIKEEIKPIEQSEPIVEQPMQVEDHLSEIRDCFNDNVLVEEYKDKVKVTVTDCNQELEIKYKMKEKGYEYNRKRGLSYFFVKS